MKTAFRLVCFWGLAMVSAVSAPKEEPTPPPPPMPQAQSVTMFRGRSVEIPLRAIGRAPSQLKFFIRTPPKYGRLGEIRLTGRKTATVRYEHDEGQTAGLDGFTYAVQAVDSAVSAPGQVKIAISEEPPALSVIHTLDFGKLWVGQQREEVITLRNTGGGTLSGRMVVAEPWRVVGVPEYLLRRLEEKKVRVRFVPTDSGEFAKRLMFSHDPRSTVTLSGAAAVPLEVEPARELELSVKDASLIRSGALTLRNMTDAERVVEVSVPKELEPVEEITVPPGGAVAMELKTRAGLLKASGGEVILSSEGYERKLDLTVFAVPPMVHFIPAEGLDFGVVERRVARRRELTLRNEGGAPARLRVDAPREVLLIPDPNAIVLAPGTSRTFEVEFEFSGTGDYRKEIRFEGDGMLPVVIPVVARSVPEKPGQAKVPRIRTDPAQSDPSPLDPSPMVPPLPEPPASDIPAAVGFRSTAISESSMELRWKKPSPKVDVSRIEYRVIKPGPSGVPRAEWKTWQGATIREHGGEIVALLSRLPRGRSWALRVVSLDDQGRASPPSEIMQLITPAAKDFPWHWWVLGFISVGLVGLVVVVIRRQREAEARADEERLTRLVRR